MKFSPSDLGLPTDLHPLAQYARAIPIPAAVLIRAARRGEIRGAVKLGARIYASVDAIKEYVAGSTEDRRPR